VLGGESAPNYRRAVLRRGIDDVEKSVILSAGKEKRREGSDTFLMQNHHEGMRGEKKLLALGGQMRGKERGPRVEGGR